MALSGGTAEIQDALCCPLTLEPFREPVILVGDGHTYEREGIEEWLATHSTSPLTGSTLPDADSRRLLPNHAVRKMLTEIMPSASTPPAQTQAPQTRCKPPLPSRRPVQAIVLPPQPALPERRPPPPLPPRKSSVPALPPRQPVDLPNSLIDDAALALQLAHDELRVEEAKRAAQAALCALDAQKARELAMAEGTTIL